ncbi:MAG: hypothetical protein WD751_10340 [Anaerolineales bacterium]
MVALTEEKSHDLCIKLLRSETEEEVIDVLKKHQIWEDRSVWKPYGDIPNNRGIVSNQQSEPVAALVEKLVNSIDAVLTVDCYRSKVDPKSSAAPQTMREAAERFYGIKDGHIQILTPSERTLLAQRIQLIACGTKENPAYTIIDDGEGQTPGQFAETFLSLVKENKSSIPFVQGKFNMGGTGVLQFAGRNSFQLIISKRNPVAPGNSEDKKKWGFTLIRRMRPDTNHPHSIYVFLAPEGNILRFEADSLPLRPGKYPQPYEEPLASGSCIKIWNYKMQRGLKSIATLDLRYELEEFLPEPVLPIRIYERRPGYKANYYDTTMSGLSAVLADKPQNIEFSDSSPLKINNVGDVQVRLVVIKEMENPDSADRYPAGLFYIVNGQLQGYQNKNFVARKTKFDYISSSLIVMVDCIDLPQEVREDIFMASRDRMREIEEKSAIEGALIEYIKDHPAIKKLNAIRRQKRQETALSQEETSKIFQSLVRSDPSLASLFGKGTLVKVPGKDITDEEPYEGKRFPTYFRIHDEPKNGLIRNCPINRSCRVEFETDAENGYFDRLEDPGHIECHGIPQKLSQSLGNGKSILKFGLPENVSVGDEFRVKVEINDISRVQPFESDFRIRVEEPSEKGEPSDPSPPKGAALAGIPNIRRIHRDQWAAENLNEKSALKISNSGQEDGGFDVAINVDNIYLQNEIIKRKKLDAKLLSYWFEWGLVLIALGMIKAETDRKETKPSNQENEQQDDIFERINRASEGIAITLIPIIYHMSQKTFVDDQQY